MATAFRIVQERFGKTAFDGRAAARFAGRWNSLGTRVVYTAGTRSLACLEILVHTDVTAMLARDYVVIEITVPDELVTEIALAELPREWPHNGDLRVTRRRGDEWIKTASSLALWVPSAVIPAEKNLLLNPDHVDVNRISYHPALRFPFDPRLTHR